MAEFLLQWDHAKQAGNEKAFLLNREKEKALRPANYREKEKALRVCSYYPKEVQALRNVSQTKCFDVLFTG